MLTTTSPLSDELDMEDDDVIDAMLFQVCSTQSSLSRMLSSSLLLASLELSDTNVYEP